MCSTCGCGATVVGHGAQGKSHDRGVSAHHHHHGHDHHHDHDHHHHDHDHDHHHHHHHHHADEVPVDHHHDYGAGPAGVDVPGLSQTRIIEIERNILSRNAAFAAANRARLAEGDVLALNLMSSPGSGKTTLLVRAISDLIGRWPIAVIEGDQQTSNDAERIRATGAPAIQINTGKGCHLDAHMVAHALEALPLPRGGVLFIENVGNLVCPAAFDLGEAKKVVVLSVTEGEDKPIKYPDMFAAADLMLINKADLIPHLDFDLARTIEHARRVNPDIEALVVSARSGEGMPAFYAWLAREAKRAATRMQAAE
ncbi:MAG TPA: hydrogenase nickel incorporation protein HypB [Xanthobacteraceae bacterium]|nr:hydrogenase nickel incorporation protein HypB [Xanthobacteraceae bacterium]